ncbi:MAG TPA: mannonate dehydratase [Prolixibacteraceae bacterium]|nr:mannonate dehydratase [Prolixibacteraceae bacterium]
MAFEKTWRWFGPSDPVKLQDLRQMGIQGVVTALHHIPNGEIWPVEEIMQVKQAIESHGLRWSVVESLPVSEGIKTASPDRERLIDNYRKSLRNLGRCGIDTVVYNFMPVLDWVRTDLHYITPNGGESMLFHFPTFAAFDIFILKRPGATADYAPETVRKAEHIFRNMTHDEREALAHQIIVVSQGFIDGVIKGETGDYKQMFLRYLEQYDHIGADELRQNLKYFLDAVLPDAEEAGIRLALHPDDPPYPVLGLPRIAGTLHDIQQIMEMSASPSHGFTFCAGSLSARRDNNLPGMAAALAPRIQFLHLRNTRWIDEDTFYESGHLDGNVDMVALMKILLGEQQRRIRENRNDSRMPLRPDHGVKILGDFTLNTNPGYPLIGRLKGLAELSGLELAIERELFTPLAG